MDGKQSNLFLWKRRKDGRVNKVKKKEPMTVILAGYNVDSTVLEEMKAAAPPRDDVTPETLSAAYARISRDPRPVDVLRAVARSEVQRARRSNRTIIFKMGHHSVAEHAVFNFDILGVSRLVIEEIQKFRLNAFTEKSQRYITLENDFVLPEEVRKAGHQKLFIDTIKTQNELYHSLLARLKPYVFKINSELAADPKKHSVLEGWAKEDARYAVSLATQGQLGMTINARNLEYMIRRFASKDLEEIKELNRRLYELAKEVAPSIILFTDPNDFDSLTYKDLKKASLELFKKADPLEEKAVRLVDYTPDPDIRLIAALLHTSSGRSYPECLQTAQNFSWEQKEAYIKKAFRHMEFYDFVLREFEHVHLTFELTVSATCFAQLKRHRMATLTAQPYQPSLGVMIPPSIRDIGAEKEFRAVISRTEEAHAELERTMERGAEYILTNAHRRRVLLQVNARELYHISRLREDPTAQWDIRAVAHRMRDLAEEVMPLTCLLAGGKEDYPSIYERVFGIKPKLEPPH